MLPVRPLVEFLEHSARPMLRLETVCPGSWGWHGGCSRRWGRHASWRQQEMGQGRFTSLQEKMVWGKEEGTPFQGRQMS